MAEDVFRSPDVLPGTHLHRRIRLCDNHILAPEFVGFAADLRTVIDEARLAGVFAVVYADIHYVYLCRRWWRIVAPGSKRE